MEHSNWRELLNAAIVAMALDQDGMSEPEQTFLDRVLALYVENIGSTLELGA